MDFYRQRDSEKRLYNNSIKSRYFSPTSESVIYSVWKFELNINKVETASDYVSWISIDKSLMHLDENFIIGSIYIPPESSNFFNDEEFATLENEITSFCSDNKYVILTGDFNARIAELNDYTQRDEFFTELFDFDDETSEFFYSVSKLDSLDIPHDRKSMDKHTNNTGYKLLDICRNNNLFVCNGRIGNDKQQGQIYGYNYQNIFLRLNMRFDNSAGYTHSRRSRASLLFITYLCAFHLWSLMLGDLSRQISSKSVRKHSLELARAFVVR